MAQVIENLNGRRSIRLSADDIISIVREYQNIVKCEKDYFTIRKKLYNSEIYLPEDVL